MRMVELSYGVLGRKKKKKKKSSAKPSTAYVYLGFIFSVKAYVWQYLYGEW